MATRFYLPGLTSPPASPLGSLAVDGTWEYTPSGFHRAKTSTSKANTSIASETTGNFVKTVTGVADVVHVQYVSDQILAQTISGTFTAVVRGGESSTSANASLQVVIRVVSADGSAVRGVPYAGHTTANNQTSGAVGQEFSTSSQTRIFPSTNLSSVDTVTGDRIAIEIGQRFDTETGTTYSGYLTLGDATATQDHDLTAGTTSLYCPWVELSGTILFGSQVEATISGTLPALTATVAGEVLEQTGTISGTLPAVTATTVGEVVTAGTVLSTLPAVTAAVAAEAVVTGTISGTLPALTASIQADIPDTTVHGTVHVTLPAVTATMAGDVTDTATLDATLPAVTATAAVDVEVSGTVSGTLGPVTASITAVHDLTGTIDGTLPAVTATVAGVVLGGGTISGTIPAVTSTMAGEVTVTAALDATLSAVTASVAGEATVTAAMAAALPAVTFTAAGAVSVEATLAATLPSVVGAIFTLPVPGAVTIGHVCRLTDVGDVAARHTIGAVTA